MTGRFRNFLSIAAVSALSLFAMTGTASAYSNDYCREYTRTVQIGQRYQEAYGTACRQEDGSWMIVGEGLSDDIPSNVSDIDYIIHDDRRDYAPAQVVYYDTYPVVYRNPTPAFIWYQNGYYRGRNYHPFRPVIYRDNRHYDRPHYEGRPGWGGRDRDGWHGDRGRGDWHGRDQGRPGRGGYDPRERAPWRDGRN